MHNLKTWPEFFAAVESGEKTFELRKDDRGFKAGDFLRLHEYERPVFDDEGALVGGRYTGRQMVVQVPYLVAGPAFGLEPGYVCMSIQKTHL